MSRTIFNYFCLYDLVDKEIKYPNIEDEGVEVSHPQGYSMWPCQASTGTASSADTYIIAELICFSRPFFSLWDYC